MKRVFGFLRVCWGILCFAVALLAILPAPTNFAWQLSIFVTEMGLWIAPLPLLALLPGWKDTGAGRVAAGLAVSAILLLLSPLPRAVHTALAAQSQFAAVFHQPASGQPFRVRTELNRGKTIVAPYTIEYNRIDGQPMLLDFYGASKPNSPLVVVVHGGSWSSGDRLQLAPLNTILAHQGYAVASIEYRLAPANPYPAAEHDIAIALAYLKSHADSLRIDKTKIVLLGRSAGGQLALLAAYTLNDPAIRAVISFYGPTDLRWAWEHPGNKLVIDGRGTLKRFIGGTLQERGPAYDEASPVRYAQTAIPTLLIHGARDELVSVHHSEMLAEQLQHDRVTHIFLELPWATHGCDYFINGPCGQVSTWAVERFLAAVLR